MAGSETLKIAPEGIPAALMAYLLLLCCPTAVLFFWIVLQSPHTKMEWGHYIGSATLPADSHVWFLHLQKHAPTCSCAQSVHSGLYIFPICMHAETATYTHIHFKLDCGVTTDVLPHMQPSSLHRVRVDCKLQLLATDGSQCTLCLPTNLPPHLLLLPPPTLTWMRWQHSWEHTAIL